MRTAYRMILLTGLVVIDSALNAQTNLDSLWSVWQDEGEPDSSRANAFSDYIITGFLDTDPDSALLLAQALLRFSEKRLYAQGKADAYSIMGLSKKATSDFAEALDYFHRSLKLNEEIGNRSRVAAAIGNLGLVYGRQGEYAKALVYQERSLKIDEESGNIRGGAVSNYGIGGIYYEQGEFPRAMKHFQECLRVSQEIGAKEISARAFNCIGMVYDDQGDYSTALDYYQRSLRISEDMDDKSAVAVVLNNIGVIYNRQQNYAKSLDYNRRSLRLSEEAGNKMRVAGSLNNIGDNYRALGNNSKALECFQKSLSIAVEIGDTDGMADTYMNIGRVYEEDRNYIEAFRYYKLSLKCDEEIGNRMGVAQTLSGIGNMYLVQGVHGAALENCHKALRLSKEIGALAEERWSCDCLYNTYKAMGMGSKALEYLEQSIAIRDSLSTEETDKLLQQMEFDKQLLADSLQHAAELAQVENERTIESLRADRNRNRGLAAGGGAFLLLAGGGAWFITDRKRRKERFEKEAATLETQALRSQMNPHFIFNALNSINAFVQQNDPDNATSFLTKFARVMRSVLENSRHSEVPLQDDLDTLRGYMDLERKRMGGAFDFSIEVDPAIDPEAVMVPPLVVQPFVENAIWHGMKGRTDKGHITLRVKQQGEQLVWQIEDDGAGRQAKQEPSPAPASGQPGKKTSLGTAITRSRLDLVQKQHGGRAGFRYEDLQQGTRVIVEMPLLHAM